jgi:hypothetical protein
VGYASKKVEGNFTFLFAFHLISMAFIFPSISSIKSIVKIGGTNLTGKLYTTGWANPSVGAMYYVSITFDELLN